MLTAQQAIEDAQRSANEETKSSAGDKYETGRAMAQLEIEKNGVQIAAMQDQLTVLLGIDVSSPKIIVQPGSLVFTNQGIFFISIAAGVLTLDNENYFAVSPVSPVAKALMGRSKGDTVSFQKRNYHIHDIQ